MSILFQKFSSPKKFEGTLTTKWRAPSNIALVKYWGKKGDQLAGNQSLSLTLKNCYTETEVTWSEANSFSLKIESVAMEEASLYKKISKFFEKLQTTIPYLQNLNVSIKTKNTFPASSGIASSASGMAALALNTMDFLYQGNSSDQEVFWKSASDLARQGSGSACRSVFAPFALWKDDHHAEKISNFHSSFQSIQDTIFIVSSKPKSISSTEGHASMTNHPYRESRFRQATENLNLIMTALQKGDWKSFGETLENEALSLHALMWSATPSFNLLLPESFKLIEEIRKLRYEKKIPVYFTIDAGPNIHLLYSKEYLPQVKDWSQKLNFPIEGIIWDEMGEGPVKL